MNKKLNMKTKFKTQKIKTLEPKPRIRIHAKNTNPANLKSKKLNSNPVKWNLSLQISHPSKPKQPPTNWQNPTHPHSTEPPHHQQIGTKPPTSTPSTTQIHVLEREKRKKQPVNHQSQPTILATTMSQPPNKPRKSWSRWRWKITKKKPRKFKPKNRCVELTTMEVRLVMGGGEVGHGYRTHSIFGSLRWRFRCWNWSKRWTETMVWRSESRWRRCISRWRWSARWSTWLLGEVMGSTSRRWRGCGGAESVIWVFINGDFGCGLL